MRKVILLIVCVVASLQSKADEGMWTIYNLPPQVYEISKTRGSKCPTTTCVTVTWH